MAKPLDRRIYAGMGWTAAVFLHGGLLAAVIFCWPSHTLPAPPDTSAISLVIVQAVGKAANQPVSVRPKPPAAKAQMPPMVPADVTNISPASRAMLPRPVRSVSPKSTAAKPMIPTAPSANENNAAMQPLGEGSAAAKPATGSANQPPDYPAEAQLHGEQGQVLLSIRVLADGEADWVNIEQSSGYKILDQSAVNAVLKWRFQPAYQSGKPVTSVVPFWIHFKLLN